MLKLENIKPIAFIRIKMRKLSLDHFSMVLACYWYYRIIPVIRIAIYTLFVVLLPRYGKKQNKIQDNTKI